MPKRLKGSRRKHDNIRIVQTVISEEALQIISDYVAKRLKESNVKPLMFYSAKTETLDGVRHNVENVLFNGRVHRIENEGTDAMLGSLNGDYTQKDVYVAYTYSNEQFQDSHIDYAWKLADRDNKPLIYFGDKGNCPVDNEFDKIFDVYEILI